MSSRIQINSNIDNKIITNQLKCLWKLLSSLTQNIEEKKLEKIKLIKSLKNPPISKAIQMCKIGKLIIEINQSKNMIRQYRVCINHYSSQLSKSTC